MLQRLLAFLHELDVPVGAVHLASGEDHKGKESLSLQPGTGVERSIRALRVLDVLDWKVFFANTNRVEAILRTDPAQVYARMDFETCDAYRKVVEALAWDTGRAEEDVATLAVTLSCDDATGERRGHVGYYLMGEGRRVLERRLGYRADALERVRRAATSWPTTSYLLPLALLGWGPVLALASYVARTTGPDGSGLVALAAATLVAVVPASAVAIAVVQLAFARLLPPRTLPKLDFTAGLPDDTRTLVVMPTLLGRSEDVTSMLRQIEIHYLSNPDPRLQFALLTDDIDARSLPATSAPSPLLDSACRGITALNVKHGKNGAGPFHLLHRDPRWNPAEERFMGWERKRGKLEELNRLLRGDTGTSYSTHIGDPGGLSGIRFVITLDSDTQLPMGSAQRLVGLLAHPLNQAAFDAGDGSRRRRLHHRSASHRDVSFELASYALLAALRRGHRLRHLYACVLGALPRPLRGGHLRRQGNLRRRRVRAQRRRARRPTTPSSATISSRESTAGRPWRRDIVLFESYPSSYAAYARRHAPVGPRRLAAVSVAPPQGAHQGARTAIEHAEAGRSLEDRRQPPPKPDEPPPSGAPRARVDLSTGKPALWTLGVLGLVVAPFSPSFLGSRRVAFVASGTLRAWRSRFSRTSRRSCPTPSCACSSGMTITRKHLLQWTSRRARGAWAREPSPPGPSSGAR